MPHRPPLTRPRVEILQREPARWRDLDATRRMPTLLRRDYGRRVNPQRVYRLCYKGRVYTPP